MYEWRLMLVVDGETGAISGRGAFRGVCVCAGTLCVCVIVE